MKNRINKLDQIRVKSFVTSLDHKAAETVKGAGLSLILCEGGISLVSCRPEPTEV